MIKINNYEVCVNHFPDGTQHVNLDTSKIVVSKKRPFITITWLFESDSELSTLIYINDYFRRISNIRNNIHFVLSMPYVPNARMDRVKNSQDVFTLKSFCNIINSLHFDIVNVYDTHSDVVNALLNNVRIEKPASSIKEVIEKIGKEDLVVFYPDNGAVKKYSEQVDHIYIYGQKKRRWEDGAILNTQIINEFNVDIRDKTILIVDDICSYGGTATYSIRALKEAGVGDIYCYFSHTENSLLRPQDENSLWNNKHLIKTIYTTNSIFKETEESKSKVEIVKHF